MAALVSLLGSAGATASTPVTAGYRDYDFGTTVNSTPTKNVPPPPGVPPAPFIAMIGGQYSSRAAAA